MSSSNVKSAERALATLQVLARHDQPVPATVIARECDIPRSSVHHLLNVMRDRQFVTYYETERAWGLGVAALEVGSAYLRSSPLERLGRPLLHELSQRTGDTAHLALLHGTEVLYIDKERPTGNVTQLVTEVGVRLPAHLTAVGRAILAELPPMQVRAIYAGQPLVRRTRRGPTSVAALLRELHEGHKRGYALDRELVTPGITCLAAAVFSHEDRPVAAIGITFISAQRSDAQIEAIAGRVLDVARRLSASLGQPPELRVVGGVA
jgi:DNA-binding IclR family transcriptional regulator